MSRTASPSRAAAEEGPFARLRRLVAERSPLQRKALAGLPLDDPDYARRAESFAQGLGRLLEDCGLGLEDATDAYLELCAELFRHMAAFRRNGAYDCPDAAEAARRVYHRPERMRRYLLGLAVSQFLWPNHYSLLDFFLRCLQSLQPPRSVLEIGPGHGLYLAETLRAFPAAQAEAVDLSPAALDLARRALEAWTPGARCDFRLADAAGSTTAGFDLAVMGEVLEHVDDPRALLAAAGRSLAPGGRLFVTTCANCPAPDHVYLFHDPGDIRRTLTGAGFAILEEIVLPVGDAGDGRIQVNYGALLAREEA